MLLEVKVNYPMATAGPQCILSIFSWGVSSLLSMELHVSLATCLVLT